MFKTGAELDTALENICASPKDEGLVELVLIRPEKGKRKVLDRVALSTDGGAEGDRWGLGVVRDSQSGEPWCDMQITLMNTRVIAAIAGERENWPPAGDQFFVDLDLSGDNLPAGQRLAIGSAMLEVTAEPHLGCDQFIGRYGIDACRFVNSRQGEALRLRGVNCRIVQDGIVRTGDKVRKI